MNSTRREFIQAGAVATAGAWLHPDAKPVWLPPPDITLRIAPVSVEIASDHIIHTAGYNGSVPGPLIRMHEGHPVSVELINETDTPELVHWHGFRIPADIDGAAEEGTPLLEPHATRRYTVVPELSGTRWVHSHVPGGPDLTRGLYSGQFGVVYVEPRQEPGRYDREVFLATHEWDALLASGEDESGEVDRDTVTWKRGTIPPASPPDPRPNGYEVTYRSFTINGHPLGRGEPIRVKRGERVMFRIVNASATENLQLALPGHQFEVVALDGNPVPTPRKVAALALGTAERIDAVVSMDHPGVWILGSLHDEDRRDGMGIVIEYAGSSGEPQWIRQARGPWDYTIYGTAARRPPPDETISLLVGKRNGGSRGFNTWTVNGVPFEQSDPITLHRGRRYRLLIRNQTDDAHPIHLHRHSFELVQVNGTPTGGVMKDTVVVPEFGMVDVDLVADNPGPTLLHCHHALHMEHGLMRLFAYV